MKQNQSLNVNRKPLIRNNPFSIFKYTDSLRRWSSNAPWKAHTNNVNDSNVLH